MKNVILSLAMLISISAYSQESSKICKTVDEFTDKVTHSPEVFLVYEDGGDMKSQGMIGMLFVREKKGKLKPSSLYLKVIGIEGCVDTGSTLDIIFENGEKSRLVNWKDFDCDGKNWFTIPPAKMDLFKSTKIKAIKYTNKRNYDTMIVKENIGELSSYLMTVLNEMDKINAGELTVSICKD